MVFAYCIKLKDSTLFTGGFDSKQVAVGSISCLNIWSSVYQEDQLVDFAECKQEGDVFTMKPGALAIHGTITSEMKPVSDEKRKSGKLIKYINFICLNSHIYTFTFAN